MSRREATLRRVNLITVLLALILFGAGYALYLITASGVILTLYFFISLVCSIIFVILFNKWLSSTALLSHEFERIPVNTLTLQAPVAEMLITVIWEVITPDLSPVTFEYILEVSNEGKNLSRTGILMSNGGSSSMNSGKAIRTPYQRMSRQISIKNPQSGVFHFTSNTLDAPAQIRITERVELFD